MFLIEEPGVEIVMAASGNMCSRSDVASQKIQRLCVALVCTMVEN